MPHATRLACALAAACALALPAHAKDPELRFEKYTLKNGLTVILSEDHRMPQVAVDVWYHVGAANQSLGRSGFAHLFEHMMFSGSKHVQPSPFKILETIGASGVNGTTNFDRTNYFEVVPSNELATALWMESDRMGFLLDTLDQHKLEVQRNVVSNERRQSYENRPYRMSFLRTCDLFFPSPHPYYQCVIGSIPEIQAASVDDLKLFFHQFYTPNNASLAIVGDFDPAAAKALVERYFGAVPQGPEVVRPEIPQAQLTSVLKDTVEDKLAEVPRVQILWTGVKRYSDEEAAGDILGRILGEGRTSRLYKSLVFEKQAASEVDAGNTALGLGGWFEVQATAQAGKSAADLIPLMQAAIDSIKAAPPTAEEVERV
ncbi:MAG: insulinase family protein, partial [Deltaproteobacteria bacterium]|nr:insulinase family protein [Deltaproteobacteria bacterium]